MGVIGVIGVICGQKGLGAWQDTLRVSEGTNPDHAVDRDLGRRSRTLDSPPWLGAGYAATRRGERSKVRSPCFSGSHSGPLEF